MATNSSGPVPKNRAKGPKEIQIELRIKKHETLFGLNYEKTKDEFARLTSREEEVMALLAQGMKGSQIATVLTPVLSPKTVDIHRANILRKMILNTTGELIIHYWFLAVCNAELM